MTILILLAGLALLIGGAELLVRGASRLATSFGITPLVLGLTVVAFGTSSPELAVSIKASLSGQAEIALGNVIGSNIFNVLFILGLSVLIAPLVVSSKLIRLDVPLMIGLSGGVWLMALDGRLSRLEGLVLVTGLVMYTSYLIYESRKEKKNPDKGSEKPGKIRDTIRTAAPEAKKVISYQMPTFRQDGILVHFAALSAIVEFEEDLSQFETSKGTIKFPLDKPIPFDLITKIVKFRAKENAEKKN